jgi:hypothetical protein
VFDLCTALVEKILRVQPGVKKLFLLVRATDDGSAKRRIQTEVKYSVRETFFSFHSSLYNSITLMVRSSDASNVFDKSNKRSGNNSVVNSLDFEYCKKKDFEYSPSLLFFCRETANLLFSNNSRK